MGMRPELTSRRPKKESTLSPLGNQTLRGRICQDKNRFSSAVRPPIHTQDLQENSASPLDVPLLRIKFFWNLSSLLSWNHWCGISGARCEGVCMRDEIYLDEKLKWHWRFYATKEQIIACSNYGYDSRADCEASINILKASRNAPIELAH